jgi:hypothetical protein
MVYILVQIDDEYGHADFKGVFSSRSAGEAFVKESKELSFVVECYGLYTSMDEFHKKNGCAGLVLFSTQIIE